SVLVVRKPATLGSGPAFTMKWITRRASIKLPGKGTAPCSTSSAAASSPSLAARRQRQPPDRRRKQSGADASRTVPFPGEVQRLRKRGTPHAQSIIVTAKFQIFELHSN